MQRKPRITAEPVEQPTVEDGLARAWNDEPQGEAKTDAEHMTEVINAVRVSDEEAPTAAEEQPAQQSEKPKAKRAAKQPKAKAVEPATEVKPALEEVQVVVELPKEDGGVKQACPDCGKQMSTKNPQV